MWSSKKSTPVRSKTGQEVTPEEVVWAFRLILGREPESQLAIDAHTKIMGLDYLRMALLDSVEFGRNNVKLLAKLPCLTNFRDEWKESTLRYYAAIENSGISINHVAAAYANAGIDGDEYARYHLRRFHELFAFLASRRSKSDAPIELLEVGTSGHTTPFYGKFLPCKLDTICRPSELGGPPQDWTSKFGGRNHWQIDLNRLENQAGALRQVPEAHYDVVICCEVIEHLLRAPREIIKILVSKLKPSGFLYLTTPNFLTPEKMERIYSGSSPVAGFSDYHNNVNAHHHFREYTAPELLDEIEAAGGTVKEVALSNCWDYPGYSEPQEIMFRSNIVIIVAPK